MNTLKLFSKIAIINILFLAFFINSCEKKKETTIISKPIFNKQQVDKYYQLANKYYDNSKYDSAFYYANKIRLEINPISDLDKYATNMFILAASQQIQGDYAGAENSIVESLNILYKIKSHRYLYKFNSMLAGNYNYIREFDNALHSYHTASKYKINNQQDAMNKLNIGHVYKEKREFKKALQILTPLLNNKEIKRNRYYLSGVLNDIGYCNMKLGKANALSYLSKSLKLNSNLDSTADNDYDLTANYYNLYEYYINSNPQKALNYIHLLYQKATEYNNPDDRLIALSLFIKHCKGEELKKYSLDYIRINDSINQARQKAKNYFAKLKYDSKKEKEENLKLKKEKELQQQLEANKNILVAFIIILLILITAFIYYYLVQKNKKEKIQTSYNTEIRIAKKLHDELANEIYQTINFAETHDLSSPEATEKLLENLDAIYSTTRNISRENNFIETGELYETHLKEMITSFSGNTVNIIINNLEEINWNKINSLKKITIYRVIQELLVNMKKHSNSTLVLISFKNQNNNLLINYYDNGVGFDFNLINKKSGLQNIISRITTINGTITFDNNQNKGVKTNIVIPS
ncbi:tetratricopeptide repeat-containing sensor histidine kinase [Flavobacterium flavipallidum]|uniref:histidine kinase n=1 Tax=Flavobacterium flavipallidum TaxID=3139140 RepID=A0ABU9HKM4_9FLAO